MQQKILKITESAVDLLKKKQDNGKMYYFIIFYAYISEK